MLRTVLLALVAGALVVSSTSARETHLVIIMGLGGEESYREKFHEWSQSMRDAAVTRYGVAEDHVYYLPEKTELAPEIAHASSTKENIAALFEELQREVRAGDQIYILLIGHGSYQSEESRFNLPGRDLTAEDFNGLLTPFSEQQIVFVNASSASGSFLPVLSKANRIVVTATKSGFERNESQFGKYFVEAYAGGDADADKNERVSVLEAFNYARRQVDRYYEEEKILKTEHAILDDDGDGEGVHDPGEDEGDIAGTSYIMAVSGVAADGFTAEDVAANPELAGLLEKRLVLEGRVEALRLQKDSMPEELYLQELEALLVELALVTAQVEERRAP